jgi:hypothetical protein
MNPIIIAEAATFDWLHFAAQNGPVGLMLAWVLWKMEPRQRANEAVVDRLIRGNMIMLMEIQRTSPEGKRQAAALVLEIDEAAKERDE